jgi:hypothetical protein
MRDPALFFHFCIRGVCNRASMSPGSIESGRRSLGPRGAVEAPGQVLIFRESEAAAFRDRHARSRFVPSFFCIRGVCNRASMSPGSIEFGRRRNSSCCRGAKVLMTRGTEARSFPRSACVIQLCSFIFVFAACAIGRACRQAQLNPGHTQGGWCCRGARYRF